MTKIVILDFDGTLADTATAIVHNMHLVHAEMGLPSRTNAQCSATIGIPLTEIPLTLFKGMDVDGQQYADVYRRIFWNSDSSLHVHPFPGVVETIKELKSRGLIVTIASSRDIKSLSLYIERFGLADCIDLILGAGQVPHCKPEPDAVLITLERFGLKSNEAIVVGDTTMDILMGARAGSRPIGATYGNGAPADLSAAGACALIDSFPEILDLL